MTALQKIVLIAAGVVVAKAAGVGLAVRIVGAVAGLAVLSAFTTTPDATEPWWAQWLDSEAPTP